MAKEVSYKAEEAGKRLDVGTVALAYTKAH